jgi:CpeT protein
MQLARFHPQWFLALCFSTGTVLSAAPHTAPEDKQTQEVADWLTGSFSNRAQAAHDTAFHHVVLHMHRIWTHRTGEHWLYVEQALATTPEKPYRQRVYHIRWEQGPVSDVYLLPGDASAFVGGWRDTRALERLTPDSLLPRHGCSIALRKESAGHYQGATRGKICGSERGGATYATSDVTLDASVLTSWDRGFDPEDRQVWGSTEGPYRFEREG